MEIEVNGQRRQLADVIAELRAGLDAVGETLRAQGEGMAGQARVAATLQDLVVSIGGLAQGLQSRLLQREVEAAAQTAVIDALITTHPDKHELRAAIAVRRAAFTSGSALHHVLHGVGDDQLQPMLDAAFEQHLRLLPKPT